MTMGGRKMVASLRVLISSIIMVNVVQAHEVANKNSNAGGDSLLHILCGPTTYKDACMKSLESAARSQGATPQILVEKGVKLALDELDKAASKPAFKANPSCTHLLEEAKGRLQDAMTQVSNINSFKDPALLLDIRLELGDVNTFATTCVDEAPPQLQQLFKDGTNHATELSVDMLDVVTVFNQELSQKLLKPSLPTNRRLLSFS